MARTSFGFFWLARVLAQLRYRDLVPNPVNYDEGNSSIHYTGEWTTASDPHVPSLEHPSPYHMAQGNGSSAYFEFTGRAVVVRGPMMPTSGKYQIVSFQLL